MGAGAGVGTLSGTAGVVVGAGGGVGAGVGEGRACEFSGALADDEDPGFAGRDG